MTGHVPRLTFVAQRIMSGQGICPEEAARVELARDLQGPLQFSRLLHAPKLALPKRECSIH